MSSFFCMTIAPPVRDEEPIERAPSTALLFSVPDRVASSRLGWPVERLFAHDLPPSFRSGVLVGAPQPRIYIERFLLSAHDHRWPKAILDPKFRGDSQLAVVLFARELGALCIGIVSKIYFIPRLALPRTSGSSLHLSHAGRCHSSSRGMLTLISRTAILVHE